MFRKLLKSISDDDLLHRLSGLVQESRRVESQVVAHIAEVDERRLYAREACSSMFAYCTEVLHLSEWEAYLRIAVARASRTHPILLVMLEDGRLHLSGIAKIAPLLTEANRETLLARAVHKSKREIEELVAELSPRPDIPTTMRKLPVPRAKTNRPPAPQLGPDQVVSPTNSALRVSSSPGEAKRRRKPAGWKPVEIYPGRGQARSQQARRKSVHFRGCAR